LAVMLMQMFKLRAVVVARLPLEQTPHLARLETAVRGRHLLSAAHQSLTLVVAVVVNALTQVRQIPLELVEQVAVAMEPKEVEQQERRERLTLVAGVAGAVVIAPQTAAQAALAS